MRVGILSDTHGQHARTRRAVELLRSAGAEMLIHCGDVGGREILDLLAGIPAAFVWGNCDYSRSELEQYGNLLGVRCFGAVGRTEAGQKRIAFLHGDDSRMLRQAMQSRRWDLVAYGHTHSAAVYREGPTLLVNPGAIYRTSQPSVAVVELPSLEVTTILLDS